MSSEAYNDGDPYFLPRGAIEFERLNKQHAIYMKHVYDNRVIFDNTVKLHEGDCVLDAGAGTCAWAVDLSKVAPEGVHIYATDISAGNFPSAETTPYNVHTSIASSTHLLPEWSDKFAFVHQRLLFGALRTSEWPVALSEMFRVLKPGGAVQLMEVRLPEPKGPAMAGFSQLAKELFEKRGFLYDIAFRLSVLVEDVGFKNINVHMKDVPIGRKWEDLGVESVQDLKPLKNGLMNMSIAFREEGLILSDAEYNALLDEMEREWNEIGAKVETCLVTARKPCNQHAG